MKMHDRFDSPDVLEDELVGALSQRPLQKASCWGLC